MASPKPDSDSALLDVNEYDQPGAVALIRQNRGAPTTLTLFAPLVAIGGLIALLGWVSTATLQRRVTGFMYCDPNGKTVFSDPEIYKRSPFLPAHGYTAPQISDSAYALSITLGWGELSFGAAKTIDIAWDTLVGRGWQALATWIIYSTFRRCWAVQYLAAVQYKAANAALPVDAAMAMQYHTASPTAFWKYLQVIRSRPPGLWRIPMAALVLLISIAYILLTPTWTGAMTGYQALSAPMIQLPDGSSVEARHMLACALVIDDGDRIGLSSPTCLTPQELFTRHIVDENSESVGLSEFGQTFWKYCTEYGLKYGTLDGTLDDHPDATSRMNVAGKIYDLEPPLLKITNIDPTTGTGFRSWPSFRGCDFTQSSFFGYGDGVHVYGANVLSEAEIVERSFCQPQDTYRWGFSFHLTVAYLATTTLLALALYVIWFNSFLLGKEAADNVFGSLRTALVVSEAVMKSVGTEALRMTNDQLEAASRRKRTGLEAPWPSTVADGAPALDRELSFWQAMKRPLR